MAGDASSSTASESGDAICPACKRPVVSSSESDIVSNSTHSTKRKEGVSKVSASSASKKLRSADHLPTGKFVRPWDSRPNYTVWIYAVDEDGEYNWQAANVKKVIDRDPLAQTYDIVVQIKIGDNDTAIPRTVHPTNQDPIPNAMSNDPDYKQSDYILSRDEREEGLSDLEVKHWRSMKYHSNDILDPDKLPEQDIIGKSILNNDENSPTTLRNILYSLMMNEDVKRTVDIVTEGGSVLPNMHWRILLANYVVLS